MNSGIGSCNRFRIITLPVSYAGAWKVDQSVGWYLYCGSWYLYCGSWYIYCGSYLRLVTALLDGESTALCRAFNRGIQRGLLVLGGRGVLAMAPLVVVLLYKPEGRVFDSRFNRNFSLT